MIRLDLGVDGLASSINLCNLLSTLTMNLLKQCHQKELHRFQDTMNAMDNAGRMLQYFLQADSPIGLPHRGRYTGSPLRATG